MKELLLRLIHATTDAEKEKIYRILERAGMDRFTANALVQCKEEWIDG